MKKRAIWIAAAACVILLCGCSHSEEAGAYLSTTSSTVEEKRGGSETNSSHSFSESKPEDAEAVKSKEPMVPAKKEESVERGQTFFNGLSSDFLACNGAVALFLRQYIFVAKRSMPANPHGCWLFFDFFIPYTNSLCPSRHFSMVFDKILLTSCK